jgi:hypothetical protein
MSNLKLGTLEDDKPVKVTVELPGTVHHDLLRYSELLSLETGQTGIDPVKLIAPMLARFMATDRAFIKLRRTHATTIDRRGQPFRLVQANRVTADGDTATASFSSNACDRNRTPFQAARRI